jgi:hypothetical protein
MTTKGLRHIQMRENAVREQVQQGLITVEHIGGKQNLSDAFTKEEKDPEHFITCRNLLLTQKPSPQPIPHKIDMKIHSTHESEASTVAHNITKPNGQTIKNPLVHYSIIRDAADVIDTSSCLLCRARGVLSYVRRTVGQTSFSSHPSSHSF